VPRKEPNEVSITQAKEEGPQSLSGRDEARKGRDRATEERIGHRARTLPSAACCGAAMRGVRLNNGMECTGEPTMTNSRLALSAYEQEA
jgi:hypothetical protein